MEVSFGTEKILERNLRGVVAKVLDCDILVSEFELYSFIAQSTEVVEYTDCFFAEG